MLRLKASKQTKSEASKNKVNNNQKSIKHRKTKQIQVNNQSNKFLNITKKHIRKKVT